nr:hypothetical protein CFP56_41346 [Quercus suber]
MKRYFGVGKTFVFAGAELSEADHDRVCCQLATRSVVLVCVDQSKQDVDLALEATPIAGEALFDLITVVIWHPYVYDAYIVPHPDRGDCILKPDTEKINSTTIVSLVSYRYENNIVSPSFSGKMHHWLPLLCHPSRLCHLASTPFLH